jgi:acetolactate synthase-1/2/3 large subunit
MRSSIEVDTAVYLTLVLRTRPGIDEVATAELARQIQQARKPVFLIGEGAKDGARRVLALALTINAPVLVTPHSKGLVSSFHPCFKGVFGLSGHQSA